MGNYTRKTCFYWWCCNDQWFADGCDSSSSLIKIGYVRRESRRHCSMYGLRTIGWIFPASFPSWPDHLQHGPVYSNQVAILLPVTRHQTSSVFAVAFRSHLHNRREINQNIHSYRHQVHSRLWNLLWCFLKRSSVPTSIHTRIGVHYRLLRHCFHHVLSNIKDYPTAAAVDVDTGTEFPVLRSTEPMPRHCRRFNQWAGWQ